MKPTDVLFCRKAVVNSSSETTAYHLLYPSHKLDECNTFLTSLFVDVNLMDVTLHKQAFIFVEYEELDYLPFEQTANLVCFLLSESLSEEKHYDKLSDMRFRGYRFGIINPVPSDFSEAFLSCFSHVLYNQNRLSTDDIIHYYSHPSLSFKKLWVDEIEDAESFEQLKETIPDAFFSGDFISKETSVRGQKVPSYKSILADLLIELNKEEVSPKALSQYIERDPALTYRIIKLTDNVLYRNHFNVSNVQRAIEIIGIKDLIKWASLVMFGSVSGKPASLFTMAVSRACFCQGMSNILFPKSEGAFLVGLFSYLPSFFNEELSELLKELPLDNNIKGALLEYSGNLGGVLKIVTDYEAGRWEKIPVEQLESKTISAAKLKELYLDSLQQAKKMSLV